MISAVSSIFLFSFIYFFFILCFLQIIQYVACITSSEFKFALKRFQVIAQFSNSANWLSPGTIDRFRTPRAVAPPLTYLPQHSPQPT